MKTVDNLDHLDGLLTKYTIKGSKTNNYLLFSSYSEHIKNKALFYIEGQGNLVLLVRKTLFFQLYYVLTNLEAELKIDSDLPVTMEILYRNTASMPLEQFSFWERNGFQLHLTRENMVSRNTIAKKSESESKIQIKYATTQDEVKFACTLIESSFDKYTGDILSIEETSSLVKNQNILLAYYQGQAAGILHFNERNNIIWLDHLAVSKAYAGLGIASELVFSYMCISNAQNQISHQLWVVDNNIKAKNLYAKFGFTFNNKISTSMLKQ